MGAIMVLVAITAILVILFFAMIIYYLYLFVNEPVTTKNNRARSKITASDLIKKVQAINGKRDYYLKKYRNDAEYKKLEMALYELPDAYNRWAQQILSTPGTGKAPMNPFVAAGIGNAVAGIGGAIVMGASAENQQNKYNERVEQFNRNLASIRSWGEKVAFLTDEIESITSRAVIEVTSNKETEDEKSPNGNSTENAIDDPMDVILRYLQSNSPSTCSEIRMNNPKLSKLSSQKVTSLCVRMVKEGWIKKLSEGNKTLYTV